MILTEKQQGILVISSLNMLPFLGDYLNPEINAEGCCPRCCAPCHVLWELDQHGRLDEVVLHAPGFMYCDNAWWHHSKVDRTWLYCLWASQDEHHTGNEGGHDDPLSLTERLTDYLPLTKAEAQTLITTRLDYEDTLSRESDQRVAQKLARERVNPVLTPL